VALVTVAPSRGVAQFGQRHLQVLADRGPGVRVVSGGYGSGKTSLGVAFLLDLGLREGHAGPILGCEPTYPMVRDVMERSIAENLDRWGVPYRHWKQAHIFEIGRARKFEVWCRSLDRPRSTEGINAIGAWIDEWELCDVEALVPAMQRVRVGGALETLLTGTPEGFGPAYDLILARPAPTTRAYIIRTSDNPFLPASYIEDSRARLGTDEAISEKLEGVRTARGGRVYSRFVRQTHAVAPYAVKPGARIAIGCDFNVRNMQWLIAEIDDEKRVAHVVGEVIKDGGTTTDEHAERVAAWIGRYLERTRGRRYSRDEIAKMRISAYVDASGTALKSTSSLSDVHLLLQAGFRPIHGNRNPAVKDRVNTLNVLFRDRRLTVDGDACPTLIKALETQAYDKAGEPEKKSGDKDQSHIVDALGYLAHWQWPVHRQSGTTTTIATSHATDEWGIVG
jgi:hypothetical protein